MSIHTDKYLRLTEAISAGVIPAGYVVKGYVRSTGLRTGDSATISASFYASVRLALAQCTSAANHIIIVLRGHSEAVSTDLFTSAATGVTIVGVGAPDEDDAPTLLWSGASSNIAVAAKNTTFANLRLVADANNITEAITVTAAGFKLLNCFIQCAVSSSADFASFLNFSTGADDGLVCGCFARATPASNAATTLIKGGTVVDNLRIVGNRIMGLSTSTTVSAISITAALTNILIAENWVDNQVAASTAAINFADVAATGFCCLNLVGTLANSTPGAEGILLAGTSNILVHFFDNKNSDGLKGTSGALAPVVTT